MPSSIRLLLCTCPPDSSKAIAARLLKQRLVACVNALPGVASRYWWRGRLEASDETLLLLKTRADRVAEVEAALREVHPYETFELLELPVEGGSQAYRDWVSATCAPPGAP